MAREQDTKKASGVTRIATVNVNGIRAAMRKGMMQWLEDRDIDILALQEVRAPDDIVDDIFADLGLYVVRSASVRKGRAGVAIASKFEPKNTSVGIETDDYFDDQGRWIQTEFEIDHKILNFISAYFPSGEVGTERQVEKMRFYEDVKKYLPSLKKKNDVSLIVGDFNVGHTELDIKNWKGNVKKSGFLPEEREYLDFFFNGHGFKDVARELTGGIEKSKKDGIEGPYTWWSNRGKAFDNDTGWRIDYQMASDNLAKTAVESVVDRAPSYDTRWSDHAPLVVDYKF